MKLTEEQKKAVEQEFSQWKDKMYADKTLAERQDLGQFFTPPELSIKMIEKFTDLNGTILDPTAGAGNLLAAAVMAGADPKLCYGNELDPEILDICRQRLEPLGVPQFNLHQGNALYRECLNDFSENYNYEKACKIAEKRITQEEAAAAKAVEVPKTGFASFFKK